ncbi:MAG TPA: exopolysaccharide biosynthesis protein [Reyranella sp.]|nr:exopolysaccharide biosynthesis protein [Reyranella sp.]
MAQDQTASQDRVPTSVQLARMLGRAEAETVVSMGWLMEQLGGRSFGLALLVMGVLGLLPGISTVAALMVVWLAVQMMLGHEAAVLPRLVARRSIGVERLARLIGIVAPWLAWLERLVQPRWPILFQTTERLTGLTMLLLGLSMLLPVPFSQIVPAPVIMLLALAYLEEDGIALVLALIAALAALSLTAATIWGTLQTVDWLDPT